MNNHKFLSYWVAPTMLGAALTMAGSVNAQSSEQTAQAPEEFGEVMELDEVVVTGIRGSIASAALKKQLAAQIIDGISAEDIGKFPDENIAESIQRINGVQIERRNGEGAAVSIRGLPQNRIEIDGVRLVAPIGRSTNVGEGFTELQALPSELLSQITVSKSPTADQVEGSLGGTVTLSLQKPLDLGDKFVYALKGVTDSRTKDYDPRGSVTLSKVSDDETFGGLVSVSFSRRSVGEELFFNRTGWRAADIGGQQLLAPGDLRFQTLEEDRDRLGVSAVLQYAPSEATEFFATGLLANLDVDRDRSWFSAGGSGGADPAGYTPGSVIISPNNSVLAGEFTSQAQANSELLQDSIQSWSLVTGFNHSVSKWDLSGRLSYGEGEQNNNQNFARFRENDVTFFRDFSSGLPELSITDGFDVLNPTAYSGSTIGFVNTFDWTSDELVAQLDADFDLSSSAFFESLEFGARYTTQTSTRETLRSGTWSFASGDNLVDTFGQGFVREVSLADVFSGNQTVPSFLAPNPNGLGGSQGLLDFVGRQQSPQATTTYLNTEDISSLYAKANFASQLGNIPFSGNFGVRYIKTDQLSEGTAFRPELGGDGPVRFNESYDDILPSFNVSFELRDDIQLRIAVSDVMSRPSTSDLTFRTSIDETAGRGRISDPNLEPFRAAAYDVSLEWYIDDATSLTGAFFHKEVDSFFATVSNPERVPGATNLAPNPVDPTDREVFLITRRINGEDGSITGLELSAQSVFDNGFGFQANYTYIDSESPLRDPLTDAAIGIEGLSKSSYNLVGFYENSRFSARLAYNWRDDYLRQSNFNGSSLSTGARGQFDFSAGYSITDKLRLTFEAVNLGASDVNQFTVLEERTFRVGNTGRRFLLGLRGEL